MRADLERLKQRHDSWRAPIGLPATHAFPYRLLLAITGGALFAVLAVLVALNVAGLRQRLFNQGGPAQIQSLAVLPLENLSRDPEQEYFADGMTDELITSLAKIRALRVISRGSVMRYKGTNKPLLEIARELNVDGVVEGSVLRSRDRVRVTAQLIQASTDKHLWAESYERDLRDVLALQDEVARTIASEIKGQLSAQEREHLSSARSVNPEAYDAYLKGRFFWAKRTEEDLKKAIGYFNQAIKSDPGYPLPYTGLADSYTALGFSFDVGALPPNQAIPLAETAVTKALEMDDSLAEAHTSLALIRFYYDWDWSGAEREFKRAIELYPSYAHTHHWYAHYLIAMGRTDESLAETRRALEFAPLDLTINLHLGWHYLYSRQYRQAIAQYRKTLELDRNHSQTHRYLGLAYEQNRMFPEAIEELQTAITLSGQNRQMTSELGHAYAMSGRKREAVRVLGELEELSKGKFVSRYSLGLIRAGLGEPDKAFQQLEEAYQERSDWLTYLNIEPKLDPLRADPRFKDLVRRVGLPD